MAVILSSRNLRSAPSADPAAVITPPVIAPAGKKVEIIDKSNPSFLSDQIHGWRCRARRLGSGVDG